MNDILYARPISSLSNGVYLMQWRRKRGGRGQLPPKILKRGALRFGRGMKDWITAWRSWR